MCIGRYLAWCELYIMAGNVFRLFDDLKNTGTQPKDMVYEDYFAPYPSVDAKLLEVI